MKLAIGIDIGTTSICLVVYEADSKTIQKSVSIRNEFLPGTFRQNPDRIVLAVQEKLDELILQEENIAAIGISTQMHGILYVDGQGRAVSNLYTWKEDCGRDEAEWLTEQTGYPMYTGYGTVTHYALQKNGSIPAAAKAFVSVGDYLAMRLCHLTSVKTSPTVAASFGGFSLEKLQFDFDKLYAAGVEVSFYPEVYKDSVVGCYRKIPVVCALGDNQASFYAAAGVDEAIVSINVGTGSQVSLFSGKLVETEAGEIRPYVQDSFLYVQASVNGGKVYEKLAAFFEETVALFTGTKVDAYAKMAELVSACESTDLKVTPSLYGVRGREVSGSIENLTADNFHPVQLIYAYADGMAEELYRMYQEFPAALREGRQKIVASGNGIRRNRLLKQRIEQKFGMPVQFSMCEEEAAAGAAMLALKRSIL